MNHDDQKRAEVLTLLDQILDVQRMVRERGGTALDLADDLLDMKERVYEQSGGPPRFTGNNRVFANGAVAYQVACRKCRLCFWVTTVVSPLCPDCDRTGRFEERRND